MAQKERRHNLRLGAGTDNFGTGKGPNGSCNPIPLSFPGAGGGE